MILASILICNLIWILYSLFEGTKEGFYWHYENQSKRVCDFDINPVFHTQRIIVLSLCSYFMYTFIGLFSILFAISFILEFSFFHNGTYYYTRNKLGGKVYEKGWRDESKTFPPFTALMKYKWRTASMIAGIIIQTFLYLFFIN